MTTIISRISILASLLVFFSCNSNEETVSKQDAVPAKEKELRDAIAQYPDSALLKKTLVQYFEDNDNFDMALAELDKMAAKDSGDATLWDKKAQLYLLKDDTAKAVTAYEKAISIFPDPQYVMSLGWLYAKTNNPQALEIAGALLQADKAKAAKEALLIKGLYYSNTGDKQKALAAFDNCLALDYTFMFAYREKAIVLYELGKYEEALQLLQKATTLQNSFDEGYYWMGQCNEKLGNRDAAIDNYRTALMYNADFIEAKDALSKLGVK
ncbi:MAG: tetratricopeptide repeat protein [Ferruginibacter sp.]